MSYLLWKSYLEDDVEKFRRLLAPASHNNQYTPKGYGGGSGSFGATEGSPGSFATSPKTFMKARKVSGQGGGAGGGRATTGGLSRAEINSRDHAGLTVLHRAASSTSANAISFALALIEHHSIDLFVQDLESGWTALHRALYFGNITIARAIIEKDRREPSGPGKNIIKVKDHEGNSPFDVYNATIARRSLQQRVDNLEFEDGSDDDSESVASLLGAGRESASLEGDELFIFGSNKNHTLGFADGDDRQYPEKVILKRPDHLLFRFYREYLKTSHDANDSTENSDFKSIPKSLADLPCLILNRPVIIHDVALSKLSSAILTTDPEANLYMCGFGPGGRLGTGDEVTRFAYTCIEEGGLAGKKVVTIALGQNHTLAVSSEGEVFSWGTSTYGQLGYSLPRPALKDDEPFCPTPRQLFGPLKRETVIGIAASAIHSVAHTSTSLFCWGKNEGQLGLMDSDSRSLAVQPVPRKVAASLFKAPISMVSAINGATICLLANHTVCVFTNYGYNMVKFPLDAEFSNYHLKGSLTTRYDAATNHISSITAGGDTIAAVSSRGDLFTVGVRKIDSDGSTTNPSKIKSALTSPQRIWSLRNGQWDGIKSVGVAENGSVIICTQAGAVWRRVKRAKMKDAFASTTDFTRKDFKFQRVPGLTKVTAVRSTTYGVFAAIRKDCDVTRSQIVVGKQTLWEDMKPLLSIRELVASKPSEEEDTESPRSWTTTLPKNLYNPLKYAVLSSPVIEADIGQHLLDVDLEGYNVEISTSTCTIGLPVHGFMLAARSSVLRAALEKYYQTGFSSIADTLVIERIDSSDSGDGSRPSIRVIFQGLDFISIVNLAIFLYTDTVIDVWHFTRQCPKMAFRYRQVRVELMKLASHLKLLSLEPAVRLMTEPEAHMDRDLDVAHRDPSFFADGDTIIELKGSEFVAHSQLLCQRCPFFDGLFNGRAGGLWLVGRREEDPDFVRVDLKHIDPDTFDFVIRYLYADVGTELFDNVVCDDLDEFSEVVMDVMGVADELMLDRLSQICQEVIGRFVNTRNVAQLLNVIAPCAITEFKDTALEYVCLQLEAMLENHCIDDLDEDLLLELDEVVRGNQLNCLPFVKSGRAELLLHERNPGLAEEMDEERQRRVSDMAFRATFKDDDSRLSSSFRTRVGSLDDLMSGSPTQDKIRRKSKAYRNDLSSPRVRPKNSNQDLMFDMEDDDPLATKSPVIRPVAPETPGSRKPSVVWDDIQAGTPDQEASSLPMGLGIRDENDVHSFANSKIWSSPALASSKLDMRDIMAQTSSSRVSNLSMSLSAQKVKDQSTARSTAQKLSQKERKKQQQQQQTLHQTNSQPQITLDNPDGKPSSPWQVAATGPKTSLKDVLGDPSPVSLTSKPLSTPLPSRPHTPRRTASPDTRFAGQQRSTSHNQRPNKAANSLQFNTSNKSSPIIPHSKSYTSPAVQAEPTLQLSMSDIIGQQRREQEVIKEAVAKRSLQEIQEEQAFQEWWEQESKRAQVEEAARLALFSGGGKGTGRGKSRGRGRGRGGRGGSGKGGASVGA